MNPSSTFAAVAAFAVLVGCGKSDESAPTIALVANGATAPNEAEALAGSALTVTIELNDDEALGSYRIDLHDASGHAHDGGEAEFFLGSGGGDWAALEVVDVTGVQAVQTHTFAIPGHVRGHWDLVVDATDATGNEAATAYMEVHVENDSIPLFEVPYTSEPSWAAGSQQALAGSVTDADGLVEVTARLLDEGGTLLATVLLPVGAGVVSVDLSAGVFSIPMDAAGEELEVELEATDALGFTCLTAFHVEVE